MECSLVSYPEYPFLCVGCRVLNLCRGCSRHFLSPTDRAVFILHWIQTKWIVNNVFVFLSLFYWCFAIIIDVCQVTASLFRNLVFSTFPTFSIKNAFILFQFYLVFFQKYNSNIPHVGREKHCRWDPSHFLLLFAATAIATIFTSSVSVDEAQSTCYDGEK